MLDKISFIKFLMNSGVLTFGDFTTKSGRKSPYFINTGNFTTGKQLNDLGIYYARCIQDNIAQGYIPDDIAALFGPAYKGIPLSVATAISLSEDFNRDISYCFNRKEQKDHGEGGTIVGHKLKDGEKILIIEDVITAGTAVRESIPILKNAANVQICGLIVAVDRMEKGKGSLSAVQEIYEDYGIPTFPIVNINEIIELLPKLMGSKEDMDLAVITKRMEDYMRNYCIEHR